MNDEKLDIKEVVRKTNHEILSFYGDLEKKIKRYKPQNYIMYVTDRLTHCLNDITKMGQTPPHLLLHSIEANCVYYKDGYSDVLDWNKFAGIANLYRNYNDSPLLTHSIKENYQRFFLMMGRQQFELQEVPSQAYIARAWSLFVNNKHTSALSKEFQLKFGISFEQWFHLAFLFFTISSQNTTRIFNKNMLEKSDCYKVRQEIVDVFYNYNSSTINQIKVNYLRIREEVEPAFHFLIRSLFLDKPIIDLEDGNMIVPQPNFIVTKSMEGLIELVRKIKNYHKPISDSFEDYVKELLDCLNGPTKIIPNNELENMSNGKSCDYIIETDSEIILVECKATTFTAKNFSDNAILNNNSSGKVAKALEQLYTTAHDIYNNVFKTKNIDCKKPIIGIAVTLGYIPLVNSEWYFDSFIMQRAEKKLKLPIYPSQAMKRKPIVISIDGFECLIRILNSTRKNITTLYDEKEALGFAGTGDWDRYLASLQKSDFQLITVVEKNFKEFFDSMGIKGLT